MSERKKDFVEWYDEYINNTPDYIRDTARIFYELGLRDAPQKVVFIPVPIRQKGNKN